MKSLLPFILILIQFSTLNAQIRHDLPNVENPNQPFSYLKPLSFHNGLKSENRIKTTTTFKMLGKVKSVKEAVYTEKYLDNPIQRISYQFLENQNLFSYEEDTVNSFFNSYAKSEHYTYDNTGEKLLSVEIRNGVPGFNTKTTFHFLSDGFLYREKFKKYQHPSLTGKNKKPNHFNHVKSYRWHKDRDTVRIVHQYETYQSVYQREKDRTYSYVSHEKRLRPNERNLTAYTPSLFLHTVIDNKYDSNGNILEWYIIDLTIKGSYNVNQLYEFKYDLNNNLIEVKYSTNGPQSEYIVNYIHKIEYLKFDDHGNWVLREIKSTVGKVTTVYRNERIYHYY